MQSGENLILAPAQRSTVAKETFVKQDDSKPRSTSVEPVHSLAGQPSDALLAHERVVPAIGEEAQQRSDTLPADERVQQCAMLEPPPTRSVDLVPLDTLLAHERVQQRVLLQSPPSSETEAYVRRAPRDPMHVTTISEEGQASVAESVLRDLFSVASTSPGSGTAVAPEVPTSEAQGKPNHDSDNPSPKETR